MIQITKWVELTHNTTKLNRKSMNEEKETQYYLFLLFSLYPILNFTKPWPFSIF